MEKMDFKEKLPRSCEDLNVRVVAVHVHLFMHVHMRR